MYVREHKLTLINQNIIRASGRSDEVFMLLKALPLYLLEHIAGNLRNLYGRTLLDCKAAFPSLQSKKNKHEIIGVSNAMESPQEPVVVRKQNGSVVTLTINRPKKLNALNREVFESLASHLKDIAKDHKNVGCVLLTGAGRAFSAGNDIKGTTPSDRLAISVINQIESLPQPVIALVNGMCYTGAMEVIAACDIVLCCEKNAYFCDTHAKLGIVPTWGGNFRLPRRVGLAQAKKVFFTCKPISPAEAKTIGLVADVVPEGKLHEAGMELANDICKNSRVSIMRQKRMINAGWRHTMNSALDFLDRDQFHPGHEFALDKAASKL